VFRSSRGITEVQSAPQVIPEDGHDTSPPLRSLPQIPPGQGVHRVIPLGQTRPPLSTLQTDSVRQSSTPGPLVSTIGGVNLNGISSDGFAPPDPNGSVGATQFVETVNIEYAVHNKTTGALELGPAQINSIWSGFGGVCQTGPDYSDPVVLYDKAAGRWLIAQIASTSSNFSPGTECIAISTTSDATGSYHRYAFSFGNNLNDYPKFGVWPDAYYASYNIFQNGSTFIGAEACAYNRTAMLVGNTASAVCFQRSSSDESLLPSDLDGLKAPSTGEPDFYLELGGSSALKLYRFHVDFAVPSNSTFAGPTTISVASFSEACGGFGNCIPQKGVPDVLASLGDRLRFRLAYRNFGDHESLVVNHSVTSGSSVGVRWYEIRSPNGTPLIYQQGTFAPDANFRWMGSLAMDQSGDIALGYSTSSSTVFPSIRYTGRVPTDTLGTMEAENSLLTGSGSQTGSSNRWGDYTSMAIDPSDDCTFWYTNQYEPSTGSFNWATYIGSFKFSSCKAPSDFVFTGNLNTARVGQTATLLQNGEVLIAAGSGGGASLSSAELYNSTTGAFTFTGSLSPGRAGHTATLLNNGMVLIAGGENTNGFLSSAELYNPTTGGFAATGSLNAARSQHTATLLNNGMVLIAGGQDINGALSSAELYNPTTGTFALTGSLSTPDVLQTATLLNNGTVLMAGGSTYSGFASAELYNPATGTFALTGNLHTPRLYHTATLLNNGMVLIAGGIHGSVYTGYLSSAELYNPATGAFTVTGTLLTGRDYHSATLLKNGTVLVAGGDGTCGASCFMELSSAELYNPTMGTFTATASLNTARAQQTATLLNNGTVLVVAGQNNGNPLASAELFQ
jgi:hypothetical protein